MIELLFTGMENFSTDLASSVERQVRYAGEPSVSFEDIRNELESPLVAWQEKPSLITFAPHDNRITADNHTMPGTKEEIKVKNEVGTVVKELEKFQERLNEIIKITTSQKMFRAQELLSLQAEVHKITQQIELMSKIVEQAISGIKVAMQTQV